MTYINVFWEYKNTQGNINTINIIKAWVKKHNIWMFGLLYKEKPVVRNFYQHLINWINLNFNTAKFTHKIGHIRLYQKSFFHFLINFSPTLKKNKNLYNALHMVSFDDLNSSDCFQVMLVRFTSLSSFINHNNQQLMVVNI